MSRKSRPTLEEQRAKERAELFRQHIEQHERMIEAERAERRAQWGRIEIERTMKPARSNKGSFKRALEHELDAMREDWRREKDWMWDDEFTYPLIDQCPNCGFDEHCVCAPEERCVQCGADVDLCECTEEIDKRGRIEQFQSMLKTVYKDMMKDLLKERF